MGNLLKLSLHVDNRPAGPWRHLPGEGEDAEADAEDGEDDEEEEAEEGLEVLFAHARLQVGDEGHYLAETEHPERLEQESDLYYDMVYIHVVCAKERADIGILNFVTR